MANYSSSISGMEQIYNFVAAHPGSPATVIGDGLGMARNSSSSLVTQLEQRGVLIAEKQTNGTNRRLIKFFRIAIPKYKLLPIQPGWLKRRKPVVKPCLPQDSPPEGWAPGERRGIGTMLAVNPVPVAVASVVAPIALTDATQIQLIMQFFKLQQQEVAKQVENAITSRIASAFDNASASMTQPDDDHHVREKNLAKRRSFPRFFLVGLLPQQAMIVSQRLSDQCDIRFWQDDGTNKLKSSCGWADQVVIMTKFISHNTQEVIKHSGKPLLQCNGGVTDLVAQIQHCLNESYYE